MNFSAVTVAPPSTSGGFPVAFVAVSVGVVVALGIGLGRHAGGNAALALNLSIDGRRTRKRPASTRWRGYPGY